MLADLFGHMGEVELDGAAAARLEVDEQRPVLRVEHVARVRLAVQQLLGGAAVARSLVAGFATCCEKLPVGVGERRSEVGARNEMLGLRDSIGEVRRRDIDLPHAGMQPLERVRVVGRCELSGCTRLVVGPQRDREAVTLVDARLHARIERGHRALGFGEPLSKLDLELGDLLRRVRDAGEDVARQQAQREPVRVVKHDRIVDRQAER